MILAGRPGMNPFPDMRRNGMSLVGMVLESG